MSTSEEAVPVTPDNLPEISKDQLLQALNTAIQPSQFLVITYDPGNVSAGVNPFTMAGFSSTGVTLTGAQMKMLAEQGLEAAILIKRDEEDKARSQRMAQAIEQSEAANKNGKPKEEVVPG